MHPIILTFVSLVSASQATHKPGHGVTVRSLVQGSGTVVCFDDARDMRPAVRVGVTVRSGR